MDKHEEKNKLMIMKKFKIVYQFLRWFLMGLPKDVYAQSSR
jgi:hypothetical protein